MRRPAAAVLALCLAFCFSGCSEEPQESTWAPESVRQESGGDSSMTANEPYTVDTEIETVMEDPVFGTYGRLIFPVDSGYYSGDTLGELQLTWYNNIDPDKTVEITNYLKDHAAAGDTVFYDIYTEEEKQADPDMNCTPFVRQYDILNNKWGVLLCQKEYQTNAIHQKSRSR